MWNSPYVLSCFVALREKRLPFDMRIIALQRGEHREPDYVASSLTARVPTLVDGALSISESSAIVEYLEDKYPAPAHPRALPADLGQRARARQLMAWVRSDVGALRDERSSEHVFFRPGAVAPPAPLTEEGRSAAKKVVRIASAVIPEGGGPLFGGAWSIADTDLAMMLWRLWKTGYELPAKVRTFAEAEWARAAVREFAGMPRPPFVAY
ncbi:MAG: putative glutathione S-transferase [Myxococcales bacterium]|nr:putative glutathione S-transferase [Myxococcales bacterium]